MVTSSLASVHYQQMNNILKEYKTKTDAYIYTYRGTTACINTSVLSLVPTVLGLLPCEELSLSTTESTGV